MRDKRRFSKQGSRRPSKAPFRQAPRGDSERGASRDNSERSGFRGNNERLASRDRFERSASPPRHELPARTLVDDRFIWGTNPVLELLRARPGEIERIFVGEGMLPPKVAGELLSRAREARVRVDKVPRERLTTMTGGGVHQGVVAEVGQFDYATLESLLEQGKNSAIHPVVVVLDGIQDPQNLGAIIRSAHAFGAVGVVVAKDRAAGITGVVAKASAGALAFCPVARVVNISRALEELKAAGYWTVAADPDSKQQLWNGKLDGPLALVIGAEGPGIRDGVLEHCDFRLSIPMNGRVASLNASVSAALLLYEVARQRGSQMNVSKPASDA